MRGECGLKKSGVKVLHRSDFNFVKVSEELADSLVVISISSDNEKRWKESSKENGITWVSLSDKCGNAGIFAHYGVNAIPFYVIISPEGKIVKTFTGYSEGRIKQKLSSIFPQYK